jgi:hypothetical protein
MSKTTNKFSPEVRDRAVRMVGEHRLRLCVGLGGADLDCRQDRLHDRDAAPLVPRGGEPQNDPGSARQRRKLLTTRPG